MSATANAASDEVDLAEVDGIVRGTGGEAEHLVPILQAIQGRFRYLPPEALVRLGELTGMSLAHIAGVASFFSQFRFTPVGRHSIKVCHGTACYVRGAQEISDAIMRGLGIPEGTDTDERRLFTVEKVACLGCCSLAPCLMIDEVTYGHLTPKSAPEAVEDFLKEHGEED
jgi:NADH-quinone oxidoreductase subunit F